MNWKQQLSVTRLTHPSSTCWSELWRRIWVWWPLKMVGTMAGIALFFAGYFWVLRNPSKPVFIMPYTRLDAWIGFQPWALPLYLSLWLYVGLLPAFLKDLAQLLHYLRAVVVLSLLGLAIFYFWPTAVPEMPTARAEHPFFRSLNNVDASGNACPSLHVAFAVFSAIGISRVFQEIKAPRWAHKINWLWCAAISWSAVATCQHVVLDAVAGAFLGLAVCRAFPKNQHSCPASGITHR